MTGYYANPAETAKVLREGWFQTGDIGFQDEAGYLFIVGREKISLSVEASMFIQKNTKI